jgi:uncharacterized protein YecE (DUF72 family)
MVKGWAEKTLDNFRFTAKFPKIITHDKYLVDVNEEVYTFLENMEPLQEKTLALTSFNGNNARAGRTKRTSSLFG